MQQHKAEGKQCFPTFSLCERQWLFLQHKGPIQRHSVRGWRLGLQLPFIVTENSSGEQYKCPNSSVADPIRSGSLSISRRYHCVIWWQLDLSRVWCHEVLAVADYHGSHAIFGISHTQAPWQNIRGFQPSSGAALCKQADISVKLS